jgi:hypothetical protein
MCMGTYVSMKPYSISICNQNDLNIFMDLMCVSMNMTLKPYQKLHNIKNLIIQVKFGL